MACDLKVDTSELRTLERSLHAVRIRMESASEEMSVLRGELGSGRLAATMDRFTSEWRVRRRRLCESLEAVEQLAGQAAERFDGCDAALAESLRKGAK